MDKDVEIIKEISNVEKMYLLLALGMLLFWIPYGIAMVVSSVFLLGAVLVCYHRFKHSLDTPYQSHYRWMIRTFWIGTGLLLPTSIAIMVWVVMQFGDMSALHDLLSIATNMDALESRIYQFIKDNWILLSITLSTTCIPVMIWWYARLLRGYKLLKQDKPIENVESWLV